MILLHTGLFVLQRDETSTVQELRELAVQIRDRMRITKQQLPKYSCEFPAIKLNEKSSVTALDYQKRLIARAISAVWRGKGNVSVPLET